MTSKQKLYTEIFTQLKSLIYIHSNFSDFLNINIMIDFEFPLRKVFKNCFEKLYFGSLLFPLLKSNME